MDLSFLAELAWETLFKAGLFVIIPFVAVFVLAPVFILIFRVIEWWIEFWHDRFDF